MLRALDAAQVDCLELAVPFPNSVSDGPTIRRSAERALANGADLDAVLAVLERVRPDLRHIKIALFADWSYTVRHQPLPEILKRIAGAGADGVLIHGLPPRLGPALADTAAAMGLPLVTSCYAASSPAVMEEAARRATAYLYLAAHYGRTGTTPPAGFAGLTPTITHLRKLSTAPIAVGFGVSAPEHLDALHAAGADSAIVGSAFVARMEAAHTHGLDRLPRRWPTSMSCAPLPTHAPPPPHRSRSRPHDHCHHSRRDDGSRLPTGGNRRRRTLPRHTRPGPSVLLRPSAGAPAGPSAAGHGLRRCQSRNLVRR